MSEGGARGKASNKTGAQRKGRARQKPDKPVPKEVKSGAGRGAVKSKHEAKLAAGGRTSKTRKTDTKRIPAGTAPRSGGKQRAKSSARRRPGDSTNLVVSESRQRIRDQLNQAIVTAKGAEAAGHKQFDVDAGAESNQGRFAGVTTAVTNHPLILFVPVPIRVVIYLAGLQLPLIHHPHAAIFNLFARCAGGGACCQWSPMRSLFRPPSEGIVQNWRWFPERQ